MQNQASVGVYYLQVESLKSQLRGESQRRQFQPDQALAQEVQEGRHAFERALDRSTPTPSHHFPPVAFQNYQNYVHVNPRGVQVRTSNRIRSPGKGEQTNHG